MPPYCIAWGPGSRDGVAQFWEQGFPAAVCLLNSHSYWGWMHCQAIILTKMCDLCVLKTSEGFDRLKWVFLHWLLVLHAVEGRKVAILEEQNFIIFCPGQVKAISFLLQMGREMRNAEPLNSSQWRNCFQYFIFLAGGQDLFPFRSAGPVCVATVVLFVFFTKGDTSDHFLGLWVKFLPTSACWRKIPSKLLCFPKKCISISSVDSNIALHLLWKCREPCLAVPWG